MRVALPARLVLTAGFLLFPAASGAQAPEAKPAASAPAAAPAFYEVRRGDTLFSIARRHAPPGVTAHQMVLALYRANPDAFEGHINRLRQGAMLALPSREAALSLPHVDAARELQALTEAKPAPAPADTKPTPQVAAISPPTTGKAMLGREDAERRYREALALERKGDDKGALQAFLDAGESGHGLAQRRLGQIYDKGSPAAPRDYEVALRWYQRAREQGVDVPKVETRTPPIRGPH